MQTRLENIMQMFTKYKNTNTKSHMLCMTGFACNLYDRQIHTDRKKSWG